MTILIVDDEPDVRESLRDAFEDVGYKVEVAANGTEALDKLDKIDAPAAVILDVMMPFASGNEVWQRMRATPRLAAVPVIMITSDPARAPSSVVTVKKPINLSLLMNKVQKYCRTP